jgi:hypothetical protein
MTIHYLNRGVKYHLGNNEYSQSVDREFLDAYPTIGLAWAQPFAVSGDDEVKVSIANLWGVDYGKLPSDIRVFIGEICLGQVTVNRTSWTSPVRCKLLGEETYMLKIATYGPGDPDDFLFEGITVETASGASVTPKGNPKVLQFTEDDYYTSNYDTGMPASPSPTPVVLAPTPVTVPTPQPAPSQVQSQPQQAVSKKETFGVAGKVKAVAQNIADQRQTSYWLLHFDPDDGLPMFSMFGTKKDLPNSNERWGKWVKDQSIHCRYFKIPKHGYEGTLIKSHFIQLEYLETSPSAINIFRMYCSENEAEKFVAFWKRING